MITVQHMFRVQALGFRKDNNQNAESSLWQAYQGDAHRNQTQTFNFGSGYMGVSQN